MSNVDLQDSTLRRLHKRQIARMQTIRNIQMNIQPIKNESDYKTTLARVERLMTARMGSPEGDELDVLTTLIQAYEAKHRALDPPDAVAAIKFRME